MKTDLQIVPLAAQDFPLAGMCDSTFNVDSKLILSASNGVVNFTIASVIPFQKRYPREAIDYAGYIDQPDRIIYLALVRGIAVGELRIERSWNGYAVIPDLVIDPKFRRQGIGRALLYQAELWARSAGLPGIMLETQDINVPACRLYQSCGYHIGGFDRYLYSALNLDHDEIALFWYRRFDHPANETEM